MVKKGYTIMIHKTRHKAGHYLLRGLDFDGQGEGPTLLERDEQSLIPVLLDELTRQDGLAAIRRTLAQTIDDGFNDVTTRKLFQPAQRTFYLVLLEAACNEFGEPRLEPKQIESAGLVIRRIRHDNAGKPMRLPSGDFSEEGWLQDEGAPVGWLPLEYSQRDDDPEPVRRRPQLRAGHPEIDRQLAALTGDTSNLAESTVPLFVAPPTVCAAAKRTLLYGLLPVTSAEFSTTPTPPGPAQANALLDGLRPLLDPLFAPDGVLTLPLAGNVLALPADPIKGNGVAAVNNTVRALRLLLDLDAFGASVAANDLQRVLNGISLNGKRNDGSTFVARASDFLRNSAAHLSAHLDAALQATPPADPTTATLTWLVDAKPRAAIYTALSGLLQERSAALFNGQRRFEASRRRYLLRAFMRVRQPNGCPPLLVWSIARSAPFTIAPWYEGNNGTPPVQIPLPDPFDPKQRAALKKLKPNVAFAVPKDLFNFLQSNNLTKLFEGEKPSGAGLALDWICSFNIPIITLCAFIVLNIFLSLLDIVFQWMLFIKLCIPIPKK